jgi:peptidoglycan hydrolase CwlO-like protein
MSDARDSNDGLERRVATVEEAIKLLTELALRTDERMDELAVAQANSEAKIAALADAQIRTEAVVAALGEQVRELATQQAHTDQRLDALIDIVRGGLGNNPPPQS